MRPGARGSRSIIVALNRTASSFIRCARAACPSKSSRHLRDPQRQYTGRHANASCHNWSCGASPSPPSASQRNGDIFFACRIGRSGCGQAAAGAAHASPRRRNVLGIFLTGVVPVGRSGSSARTGPCSLCSSPARTGGSRHAVAAKRTARFCPRSRSFFRPVELLLLCAERTELPRAHHHPSAAPAPLQFAGAAAQQHRDDGRCIQL